MPDEIFMNKVDIRYVGDGIVDVMKWLVQNIGGPVEHQPHGPYSGNGWQIYHTTKLIKHELNPDPLPYLITRAEFDNEENAILFSFRWSS